MNPPGGKKFLIEISETFQAPGIPRKFIAPLVGLQPFPNLSREARILATAKEEASEPFPLVVEHRERRELCFSLKETLDHIRFERYSGARLQDPIVTRLPFDYSQLPMWMIGLAYRAMAKPLDLPKQPDYPSYPLDLSADGIFMLANGGRPVQWPESKRYAIVLTHDVDTGWLFKSAQGRYWLEAFRTAEEKNGARSAWYCVPECMHPPECRKALDSLFEKGHEIGVHGLTHDAGLAKLPPAELERKFAKAAKIMGDYGEGLGYRAPWLSRSEGMYRALSAAGFLYDASAPNADCQRNNAHSNNGCGTVFPFLHENIVLLPVTLPQDSMRLSLAKSPKAFWDWILKLAGEIKETGGVAVISTHIQPHHSANPDMLAGYETAVSELAREEEAWLTTPKEVAKHAKQALVAVLDKSGRPIYY